MPARRDSLGYLLLALASFLWATNWVVGRGMRDAIPPVAMGFWRWTIVLAILLPFALADLRGKWRVFLRHWPIFTVLGAVGTAGYNTLVYVGVAHTPATSAVLYVSMSPILIVLISWAALRERLSALQIGGIAISFAGIATISMRGQWNALGSVGPQFTDVWLMLAMLCWALYTVLLRWRPRELSAIGFLFGTTLFGVPILVPFYLWELAERGGFALNFATVSTLLYYAVFPSVIAYLFWNSGVARVGASRAGPFFHLLPAFGAVLAVVFLGERLEAYHFVGIALILVGVYVTTLARRTSA